MKNADLQHKIDSAKDGFGVITPQALHDQLNTLTAADWRQASQIYKENPADPNGFYITDDANGHVQVHNDLRAAKVDAASPLNATLSDANGVKNWALGAVGVGAIGSLGWGAFYGSQTAAAFAEAGIGIAGAQVLVDGAIAAGTAGLYVGAALAIGGTLAAGGDFARNALNQSSAKADVATAGELTVQPSK